LSADKANSDAIATAKQSADTYTRQPRILSGDVPFLGKFYACQLITDICIKNAIA
jgi:hypothetical protein